MKTNTLLGFILIALGVAAFGYYGVTYTTQEKVVDLGPIQVTSEKTHRVPMAPILGGIILVSGIAMLVASKKD